MKYYILLLFLILNSFGYAKDNSETFLGGPKPVIIPTVHVISIGINEFKGSELKYAVSDSRYFIEKIKKDSIFITLDGREVDRRSQGFTKYDKKIKVNFNIYNLTDENASVTEIRKALKEIIIKADVNDYFIFYYAGMSFEANGTGNIHLATYNYDVRSSDTANSLSLLELSQLLEQIKCKNQLIVSDACYGDKFSEELIKNLFESNTLIAQNTIRNRIILTTKDKAYESEEISGGYLTYYLLDDKLIILDIFNSIDVFDFRLTKVEMQKPMEPYFLNQRYTKIYSENEYTKILKNSSSVSRGSKAINTIPEDKKDKNAVSQTHALLVATNSYNSSQEWNTLKNPINDANSVAELLVNKYNVTVSKQYNKSYKEILEEIVRIKNVMNENDKFIFFVAGHGYYSDNLSDGFLVLQDSKETTDDFGLNSYLSMATLQRLLDNMPSKNVFAIFDVCFGLTFDPLSKDLALAYVKKISKDISLDEFITRKNEKVSRIFLASGRYEVPDYWNNSLNHSPFADKLIKSLNSETDFTNPSKIYSALEGNITQPFLKQFGKHDERGDFLLKVK